MRQSSRSPRALGVGAAFTRAAVIFACATTTIAPGGLAASSGAKGGLSISASTSRGKRAPWTLRYYTLRGASIDFLLKFPDVFAKSVGGHPVILRNDVYSRLKSLLDRFSTRYTEDLARGRFLGKVGSPSIESSPFIGKPMFAGDSNGFAGYLPSDKVSGVDLGQVLRADAAWRMTSDQLDLVKETGALIFWRSCSARSMLPTPPKDPIQAKSIAMMNEVSGNNPPFGFFLQSHRVVVGGCGDLAFYDFAYPRYLNVRVAVIENSSGRPLTVGDFQGSVNAQPQLRTARVDDKQLKGNGTVLGWGPPVTVNPGERLVIPVRMAFSFSDYQYASGMVELLETISKRPNTPQLTKFLGAVKAAKKGFAFHFQEGRGKERTVMMSDATLSKFAARPWRNPLVSEDFIYGSSYRLATFKVSSQNASRPSAKTQSLDYTTAEGFGSCPFLYVWDSEKALWLDKGRVLVNHVGPAEETTETVELSTIPERIAIREREAEETHLTGVSMEIVGSSGQTTVLHPEGGHANGIFGQDEEREFRFILPSHLVGATARLHISGYYVRKPGIEMVSR